MSNGGLCVRGKISNVGICVRGKMSDGGNLSPRKNIRRQIRDPTKHVRLKNPGSETFFVVSTWGYLAMAWPKIRFEIKAKRRGPGANRASTIKNTSLKTNKRNKSRFCCAPPKKVIYASNTCEHIECINIGLPTCCLLARWLASLPASYFAGQPAGLGACQCIG